jgi:hypothetical protein
MTKKDYELIAHTLRNLGHQTHNWQAVALSARHLAMAFTVANERFRPHTFYIACGLALDGTPR